MTRTAPPMLAWLLPLVAMAVIAAVIVRFGGDGAEATTPYSGAVPISWRQANPPEMRACVIGSATGNGTFDQQSRNGAGLFADRLDALGYNTVTRHIGQNITWANIAGCIRDRLAASDTNDIFVYYHTTHGNRNLVDGTAAAREPQNPQCQEAVVDALDDDLDGWVNDGCDAVGAAEVACDDRADNDGDNRVNDGCAQHGDPDDERDDTVAAGDGEQPDKQPGLPGQMIAEINGPDGDLEVSGTGVRDDALAAEIARELVGKPDIGVVVIIDSCFAGEHADGLSDNGRGDMHVMLRHPSAILLATERQYTCFSEDGTQPDRYAGGNFNRAGAFTNYLIKGLETTATKAACQGNAAGRADAVGSGVPGADANNFGQLLPNLDCVTTARELFNFSSQRTASSQADSDDYNGIADDRGADGEGVTDPHFDSDGDCVGNFPANPAAPGARAGPCANNNLLMPGGINEDPPEFNNGIGPVNDDADARTDEDGLSFSGLTSCNALNSGADRCRQYPQLSDGGIYGGPKFPPTATPTVTPTSTPTPTATPTATPTPTPKDPGGDTDGDGDPNGTDPDDDNDGCTDVKEAGSNQGLGGRRNPHLFWDFFDVPTPPSFTRNSVVNVADIAAVVARFGAFRPGGVPSKGVAFAEAQTTPAPAPAYHAGYDRTQSMIPGEPWRTNPPNGSINVQDIVLVVQQFGHSCL